MDTLESLQAELTVVAQQLSYIYSNLHMSRLEIQTPNGKTAVWHTDFAKTLELLEKKKLSLQNRIALLDGTELQSVVNWGMPSRAVPIVYTGN